MLNAAVGVLYLWGLFLIPLEEEIHRSRADLSLVPAIALAAFTIGMVAQNMLLRRFGLALVTIGAFALAGGGHLLFALFPTYDALLLGYGVGFGIGSGIGYGLALYLASSVRDDMRGLAVGVAMAAFATSGIVLPLIFGESISTASPKQCFAAIGIVMLVVALAVLLLSRNRFSRHVADAGLIDERFSWISPEALALGAAFFLICFVGLTVVAHSTGIASANELPSRAVDLMPTSFMLGYLVGSLFGGKLVEWLTGWAALVVTSTFAGIGLWLIDLTIAAAALAGAAAVGMAFGSSASLMPTLIGERYGPALIGAIYSKLMIAYGLAGLFAPWTAGLLFNATGSYRTTIILGIGMCVLAAALGLALRQRLKSIHPA
jgi:OFA family oxalate/formate antiporter-like MFS transporter